MSRKFWETSTVAHIFACHMNEKCYCEEFSRQELTPSRTFNLRTFGGTPARDLCSLWGLIWTS